MCKRHEQGWDARGLGTRQDWNFSVLAFSHFRIVQCIPTWEDWVNSTVMSKAETEQFSLGFQSKGDDLLGLTYTKWKGAGTKQS